MNNVISSVPASSLEVEIFFSAAGQAVLLQNSEFQTAR